MSEFKIEKLVVKIPEEAMPKSFWKPVKTKTRILNLKLNGAKVD